jgi:hypothetical protein
MRPGVISLADDASPSRVGRALVSHGLDPVVVAAGTPTAGLGDGARVARHGRV